MSETLKVNVERPGGNVAVLKTDGYKVFALYRFDRRF